MKSFIPFVLAAFAVASAAEFREKVAIDGKCPVVPFAENFDSEKFLGKWYAVKETGKEIPCVSYDLEETRPYHFHGFMTPLNLTVEFDKKNVDDFSEGLAVTFKVNPFMHEGVLRIFSTDYGEFRLIWTRDGQTFHEKFGNLLMSWTLRENFFTSTTENFAGIFICKETEDFHYQTISYWSRSKTLSGEQLANLDDFLAKYEKINLTYMKDVKQDACEASV